MEAVKNEPGKHCTWPPSFSLQSWGHIAYSSTPRGPPLMLGGEVERAPAPMRPAEESGCTDSRPLGCWVAVAVLIGSLPPVRLKAAVSTAATWFHHSRLVLRAWLVRANSSLQSRQNYYYYYDGLFGKRFAEGNRPVFWNERETVRPLAGCPASSGKKWRQLLQLCQVFNAKATLFITKNYPPPPPNHPPPPPNFLKIIIIIKENYKREQVKEKRKNGYM